eukprot:1459223-Rhodomonas_salina.1
MSGTESPCSTSIVRRDVWYWHRVVSWYAMCGTDGGQYAAIRVCYAMSGPEIGYAATRCPVLRYGVRRYQAGVERMMEAVGK